MFKNYFITAYRSLWRNKSFTIINVLGLAVGISVCLLIFLLIQFELSFDQFHPKKDRIYRLLSEFHTPDGVFPNSGVPFPTAPALKSDFPQLEKVARVFNNNGDQITINDGKSSTATDKKFKESSGVFYMDPEFFDIFSFKWIEGNPQKSLKDPNMVVLTKSTANKYFGDWKSAIGKTLMLNNKDLLKVSGIMEDAPSNTDFQIKMVISFSTSQFVKNTDWVSTWSNASVFILAPPTFSPTAFNKQLVGFVKKYKPAEYQKDLIILQPINNLHYDSGPGNYLGRTISKELITSLSLIALFILVIACVNFINLTTAQAVNRSKEVGVRKVLGSNRWQLAVQFLAETSLITFMALIIAVGLSYAFLPLMNKILDLSLHMNFFENPFLIGFLLAVGVIVTLLSGFYPALVLSAFNPITALRNRVAAASTRGLSLRRGLVIVQFIIAQILIISTLIVVKQMDYFTHTSLGFDKESIVNIPVPGDSISHTKIDYVKRELLAIPGVSKVSCSFASPSDDGNWYSDFKYNHSPKSTNFSANLKWADADYFDTYGLKLVAGRKYYQGDTIKELVVNETLVKKLGLKDPNEILGKELNFWDGRFLPTVVGVVKDFHAVNLRQPMAPVILGNYKTTYGTFGIKLKTEKVKETMSAIEKVWTTAYPEYVFESKFLDQKIANFYQQEKQLSQLYKIFAIIAIFISCLGLYGLASFMAVQRVKEVGIRKVLGASVTNIIYLFSREFVLLIAIAFVIAFPIAYHLMNKWLQDFAYKTQMQWWIFGIAAIIAIVIALCTVSFQAVRAAIVNPVKSLRTE
jgi:putative ABC transport system permease protein